eukprot:TRINITY_DN75470_c0_g1_i1.p1 TRINITY_DN75470_c0_g1~~TRINITY_DN75470_c0_g1_i1.p1  ORF type:complete len:198 (+),score=8.32 TRINITY_DN75470_c0_g1_i1:85-678(+)
MAVPKVPEDLEVAHVDSSVVDAALNEIWPELRGEKGELSTRMFELGWSYVQTTRACALRPAALLREFPCLRALLVEAMSVLTGVPNLDESRLNVICRLYRPGDSLTPHQDLKAMFEEDVYGCVLKNSSNSVLTFTHRSDVFRLSERPGTCFRQRGAARYEWLHGVDGLTVGERISVTWRWIRADSVWYRSEDSTSKL